MVVRAVSNKPHMQDKTWVDFENNVMQIRESFVRKIVIPHLLGLSFLMQPACRLWKDVASIVGSPTVATIQASCRNATLSGKHVLLDFYAPWCGPCKKLDELMQRPEIKSLLDQYYVVIKVNEKDGSSDAVMTHFGITGFPALLVLSPDGSVLSVLSNVTDENHLKQRLEDVAVGLDRLALLLERWKVLPDAERTAKAAFDIGKLYVEQKNEAESVKWLRRSATLDTDPGKLYASEALYKLAYNLYVRKLKNHQRSQEIFRELIAAYPKSQAAARASEDVTDALWKSGKKNEAYNFILNYMNSVPANLDAVHYYAQFCLKYGVHVSDAVAKVREALERFKLESDFPLMEDMAELYAAEGQCQDAIEIGASALKKHSKESYTKSVVEQIQKKCALQPR